MQMCFDIMNIFLFLTVNISWNVKIEIIFRVADFIIRNHTAVFGSLQLVVEYVNDFMNILFPQPVLVAVFHESFACINHEDSFSVGSVFFVQNNYTGRDTCAVKKVGRQTNNTFYVPLFNYVFTYFSFSTTPEKNTVWKDDSSFPGAFH